jgi:CubicO group peptidase (beta-lactamase class C family)
VTPETLFFGGSTTKAFTAAALAVLIANGNHTGLSWKTPVVELIRDDFVLEDEVRTGLITVEDVLSHRTGMPRREWCSFIAFYFSVGF